jgi:hypothetical protein
MTESAETETETQTVENKNAKCGRDKYEAGTTKAKAVEGKDAEMLNGKDQDRVVDSDTDS